MIQNVIFGILFMKILFLAYNFFIFAQMYQRPSSAEFLFNFRFSIRKSQSQQKLGKKIAHFRIQFRSKNITHFTNLDSFDIENNMLLQYTQKPFRHVSAWCQRKNLHCTISWHPRAGFLKYFESKCLYISVYLCKKIFFPKT